MELFSKKKDILVEIVQICPQFLRKTFTRLLKLAPNKGQLISITKLLRKTLFASIVFLDKFCFFPIKNWEFFWEKCVSLGFKFE
jgi:hypothetical protein